MQKYLVNSAGMSIKTASYVMTGCLFLYMCMQPVFGALGTLATVPILTALRTVSSPELAFVLIAVALAIVRRRSAAS